MSFYRVEIADGAGGCSHCHAGRYWTVVYGHGDNETEIGTSWCDEKTADDICALMNQAFEASKETQGESTVSDKFEAWGLIELMGHQRIAGRISEQVIGGGNLVRVDVPDGESFRTVYYGASAIYALHVTDEAAARAAAKGMGAQPAFAWELLRQQGKLAAPERPPYVDHNDDDDTDDTDRDEP